MSAVEEIKARLDIVEIVSESVQLRRSGKSYSGFCPFHSNTKTPAFVVFPESGTWRCFGQCSEGGDIFSYVMKKEGWDFPEALHYLAERAGVELKPQTQQTKEKAEEFEHLRALLEDAVLFFRHQLLQTEAGKSALDYLHQKRELTDETIETWGLGYAPDSWDAATQYFLKKGYTQQALIDTGMVSQRDSGGVYDRFRNRLIIPIRDERSRMVGFGARALAADDMPKYLNSPQTALFDKGKLLYGFDRARKAIREKDQVVIVEGYFDVIGVHQGGFLNTVSPMGTALTEHHLRMLKRRTRRIVLALDPDAAGDKATLRGLQLARETLDRSDDPTFDARGLLRHEARLQADIRVCTLPDELDPDEVVNRDPAEWTQILESAKPIVAHVMDTLMAGKDLEDPKVKIEIAGQVMPLIHDLPNAIERDTYRQRLARVLQVDERSLATARVPKRRASRRKPQITSPRPARTVNAPTSAHSLEAYCLGIILRVPEHLHLMDRNLQEFGLARLSGQDFQSTIHRILFELVQTSLEQTDMPPAQYVLDHLSLELMPAADLILEQTGKVDMEASHLLDDVLLAIIRLRRQSLGLSLNQLRYLLESIPQFEDFKISPYQQLLQQHLMAKSRLDQAMDIFSHRALLNG